MTFGSVTAAAHLGPLPPNVRVERWVPQDDVLPHAAVARAAEALLGDTPERRRARRLADAIAALPPVDEAVEVLVAGRAVRGYG